VNGARDELQPLEALLELTVQRVRMVAVAGRLGLCSGAEVVVKVGGGVQMMSGVGVVLVVRMRGATLVGVAGAGMAEGMVGMEAGARAEGGVAEKVGAGVRVAGVRAAVGMGVRVVTEMGGAGRVGVAVAVEGLAVGEGVAVAVAGVSVGVRVSVPVVRSH
jgi:hypothetical protein